MDVMALGIGGIIGSAIFTLVGSVIAVGKNGQGAGPSVALAFLLTAIACGFCALCYAEFASRIPVAGSAYTYAYATLGELIAWIIGWDLLLEYAISNSVVAMSWSSHIYVLFTDFGIHIPEWAAVNYHTAIESETELAQLALKNHPSILGLPVIFDFLGLFIVMSITLLLLIGVEESVATNKWIVSLKLMTLVIFIVIGLVYVNPENWSVFMPNGPGATWYAASNLFFAYIGFDAVSTAAEECKNPRRDLIVGILGSLGICMLLYICVVAVLTGIVWWEDVKIERPLVEALRSVGSRAAGIVAIGAVLATTTTLLVFQYGQTRIFFRMSQDGLLPPIFGKVHTKYRTPYVATFFSGILVALVSAIYTKKEIVDLTVIGTLVAFILVCGGIMVLRWRFPNGTASFRTPFVPLVPLLGIASCLALMWSLSPDAWVRFRNWFLLGLVIYFVYGFRRSRLNLPSQPGADY
ncbi:amino acid permease [Nitrospira sp. Nam80]